MNLEWISIDKDGNKSYSNKDKYSLLNKDKIRSFSLFFWDFCLMVNTDLGIFYFNNKKIFDCYNYIGYLEKDNELIYFKRGFIDYDMSGQKADEGIEYVFCGIKIKNNTFNIRVKNDKSIYMEINNEIHQRLN